MIANEPVELEDKCFVQVLWSVNPNRGGEWWNAERKKNKKLNVHGMRKPNQATLMIEC